MRHPEHQYLDVLRHISETGDIRVDRTKVGTRAVFGVQCRFDLSDGTVPVLTTKMVSWKSALKELLWFLSGETNIRPLLEQKVTIWTDWPLAKYRRETGDQISQKDFETRIVEDEAFAAAWGDLGPVYGKQWRKWRDYDGGEIDQVAKAVELIRNDPFSRRIIIEGWNVSELHLMALTPCHKTYQFVCSNINNLCLFDGVTERVASAQPFRKRLSLILNQRSSDFVLGVPFNWVTGSIFLHMMAHQSDMEPGELIWQSADTHTYLNHGEAIATQLSREPKAAFPKLVIKRKPEDIFSYRFEDFELVGYDHHPAIKADVAV